MSDSDTIAAISTALGNSGINIIRISGKDAFRIIESIFKKGRSKCDFFVDDVDSHTIHYGYIEYEGNCIDEVMVSVFKNPNSYTKENLAEINCHGSSYIAKKILKIIISLGARLAMPGEFSKRAFMNGRIDLSQAEAVMELIRSGNDNSLKVSMSHINGDLSDKIKYMRNILLNNVAYIEAALDDPEHYSLDGYNRELKKDVVKCLNIIDRLIDSFSYGRIITEGINTVIVGKPNAGKSSLMNNLLNEDKAIVTDIPGTTRDVIEYSVNIGDMNINLFDTAGIHETEDVIEKIGIGKTYESLNDAQLVLYVIDISDDITDVDIDIYNNIKEIPHIIILNKSDKNNLCNNDMTDNCNVDFNNESDNNIIDKYRNIFEDDNLIIYSALYKSGYDSLVEMINKMFLDNSIDTDNEIYITSVRHFELLDKARGSLTNVIDNIECDLSEDMITIDIMDSYEYLGLIIGEVINDDLFDKIFSEFCMGK